MNPTQIDPEFAVSPQIRPEDVADIAAQGFRAILCNRPDDEEAGQPTFAEIAAAAEAAGLPAAWVPVRSGMITEADVADFGAAVAALPKPVFAYCRSGARCQTLRRLAG